MSAHGGIITSEFLENIRSEKVVNPRIQPDSFATSSVAAPRDKRELEQQIVDSWDRLRERWDAISNRYLKMSVSDARSKWMIPLFRELGFDPVFNREDVIVDGDEKLRFKFSHKGWNSLAAPIIHMVAPLQDLEEEYHEQGEETSRRGRNRSPHDELQTFLNVNKRCKWGIVANGILLRILREYFHTTTKGYVEFDVENIFREMSFTDFRSLYRMAHASRFLIDKEGLCHLEQFYKESGRAGVSIGENLRGNVKKAIEFLGNGFLSPDSAKRMINDEEFCRAYYSELLRIVYRLLFLLFAEQRAMLPTRDSLYAEEYSITRLRETAETRGGKDEHTDLWEGLKVTFQLLKNGCQPLKVFGYNGSLFDDSEIPILSGLTCKNEDVLAAVYHLTLVEEEKVLKRINYLDIGVEEIGSIYESLLEFIPKVFAGEQEVKGERVSANAFFLDPRGATRKTTGSYYTKHALIDELIKSALKPVVERKLVNASDKEQALLSIKVCDPACGSGAFLIAANNYLAKELAKLRTKQVEPSDKEARRAKRDVLQHCIYGVDLNTMAVELAKISLWINSCIEDMPLNFLDHHVKCGNSLIGALPELIDQGIPDKAFTPVEGDDKAFATGIQKQNSLEKKQRLIQEFESAESTKVAADYATLNALDEETVGDVEGKKRRYVSITESSEWRHRKLVADVWTASFFWPLRDGGPTPPTEANLRIITEGNEEGIPAQTLVKIEDLARSLRFFHWWIEFPDVFTPEEGGFDCVLGNPPWNIVELNEDEFFTRYLNEDISHLNKKQKQTVFKNILDSDKRISEDYRESKTAIEKFINYIKQAFQHQKVDRTVGFPPKNNTYRLFIERFYTLADRMGCCGMITPLGIQGDEGCVSLKRDLLFPKTRLGPIYGFKENNDYFSVKQPFAIFSYEKGRSTEEVFFYGGLKNLDEVKSKASIPLKIELLEKLSPELMISEFANNMDFAITEKLYRHSTLGTVMRSGLLDVEFGTEEINETRSSRYFSNDPTQIPFLKGDSIIAYLKPAFSKYIDENHFRQKSRRNYANFPRLIWGDIRNINMSKRLCFTLASSNQAIGNSLNFIVHKTGKKEDLEYLCGILNSFIIEYRFRKISSNNHVNKRLIKDMPICTEDFGSEFHSEIIRLVDELRRNDYSERSKEYLDSVARINAVVARMYNISKDELGYVMDSFIVLHDLECKNYGSFLTKSLVSSFYDMYGGNLTK